MPLLNRGRILIGDNMKIKMLRYTVVDVEGEDSAKDNGPQVVNIGRVVSTNELDARMLIGMKKAEPFKEPKRRTRKKADV